MIPSHSPWPPNGRRSQAGGDFGSVPLQSACRNCLSGNGQELLVRRCPSAGSRHLQSQAEQGARARSGPPGADNGSQWPRHIRPGRTGLVGDVLSAFSSPVVVQGFADGLS